MRKTWLLLPLLALTLASGVSAAPVIPEFRPRAGAGFDPEEFVIGGQVFLRGRLAGLARMAPSIDVGFGDGFTATLLNFDLLSTTLPLGDKVGLYGGAGVNLAFYGYDGADGDSEFGVTFVGGADIGNRLYTEVRLGMDEMPELRWLAGIRLVKKGE